MMGGKGLGSANPVNLGRHDEVALRQAVDFVSPQSDLNFSPRQKDVRMVALLFGDRADTIHEFQRLLEVRKPEFTMDVMLVGDRPPGDIPMECFDFFSTQRRHTTTAGDTFLIG